MKNLLPRVLWDYIVGTLVGVAATVVALAALGFVLQVILRTGETHAFLRDGLVTVGFVTLVGVLLVVTIYEVVMWLRARGKMMEPGTTESRVLSREALLRALIAGAGAGVYTAVVAVVFARLAYEAEDLNLLVVFILGLLPAVMVIAAGALAYAYLGEALQDQPGELNGQEQMLLLALPLILTATLGFLFGAAAGDAEGVFSALIAALLTYALIRGLEGLRWRVIRRSLKGLLGARGGPTIKVVSTH